MMIQNLSFAYFGTRGMCARYVFAIETYSQPICLPLCLQADSLALETKHRKNNINRSAAIFFLQPQQQHQQTAKKVYAIHLHATR